MALLNFRGFKPLFFSNGVQRRLALCFHDISENSISNLHQVSPEIFRKQLISLKNKGYRFLSADDFLLANRLRIWRKTACVTFDDGYKSVLKNAAPILRELNIPGTLFLNGRLLQGKIFWRDKVRVIVSNNAVDEFRHYLKRENTALADLIDFGDFYRSTKKTKVDSKILESYLDSFFRMKDWDLTNPNLYLNKDELRELVKFDVTVGNHTLNHYRLSSLSVADKQLEVAENRKAIVNSDLIESKVFAFPFGENGSFDQQDISILKKEGYRGFFMTNQGQSKLNVPNLNVSSLGLMFSNRVLPPNENIFA